MLPHCRVARHRAPLPAHLFLDVSTEIPRRAWLYLSTQPQTQRLQPAEDGHIYTVCRLKRCCCPAVYCRLVCHQIRQARHLRQSKNRKPTLQKHVAAVCVTSQLNAGTTEGSCEQPEALHGAQKLANTSSPSDRTYEVRASLSATALVQGYPAARPARVRCLGSSDAMQCNQGDCFGGWLRTESPIAR